MARVSDIEWAACMLEPRRDAETARRIREGTGVPGRALWYFSGSAWAPEAVAALQAALATRIAIDSHIADLVGLVVSQDNSCRYCYAAQRALLRVNGFSQDRIAELEQDYLTAELDPRERAALDFARRVSRSNPLPTREDAEALRELGFEDREIRELAGVVGAFVFLNRISTLPALPVDSIEMLPDKWYVKLLAPVIGPLMLLRFRRNLIRVEPLRPEQKEGPFGYLVEAFDGLALAEVLHQVLEAMWQSPVLTRRCKALVFAVVARALECRRSEAEATELLRKEGMDEESVAEVLAHLTSDQLDEVEALIVPFARETVWFRAADIQRRAREMQAALSEEQFLELILVAALANAVCRLGIVAGGC
jgi:AhpD family alkylhydroperoxidase